MAADMEAIRRLKMRAEEALDNMVDAAEAGEKFAAKSLTEIAEQHCRQIATYIDDA